MRKIYRLVTICLISIFVLSCKTQEVRSFGRVEHINANHVELSDSTRHRYKLEIIKIYQKGADHLEREEIKQEGEIKSGMDFVRDTVYIDRTDTLYIAKSNTAPAVSDNIATPFWKYLSILLIIIFVLYIVVILFKKFFHLGL